MRTEYIKSHPFSVYYTYTLPQILTQPYLFILFQPLVDDKMGISRIIVIMLKVCIFRRIYLTYFWQRGFTSTVNGAIKLYLMHRSGKSNCAANFMVLTVKFV